MGFKCERCRRVFKEGQSARELIIPNGVRTVCFRCFKPENNEKYKEYQREMQKERDKERKVVQTQASVIAEDILNRRLRRQSRRLM